jgi:phosphoribosylformylglycinamidine cyclo-ligase
MSVARHPALAPLLEEQLPLLATPGFFLDRNACGVVLDPAALSGRAALVARTVGAGRKLALARRAGRLEVIGADLVHYGVNEVLAAGATPLLFTLHVGGARLAREQVEALVSGVVRGCRGNHLALVDADAHEAPGLYAAEAPVGTVVGTVPAGRRLDGGRVGEGDIVFGLGANGLHSDGYEVALPLVDRLDPDDELPGCGGTMARILLALHKSYRGVLLRPLAEGWVRSLAHVTAGGLTAALARAAPPGLGVDADPRAWPLPPAYAFLAREGRLGDAALRATFNVGIGMVAVVSPDRADEFTRWMGLWQELCYRIGRVRRGEGVRYQ